MNSFKIEKSGHGCFSSGVGGTHCLLPHCECARCDSRRQHNVPSCTTGPWYSTCAAVAVVDRQTLALGQFIISFTLKGNRGMDKVSLSLTYVVMAKDKF